MKRASLLRLALSAQRKRIVDDGQSTRSAIPTPEHALTPASIYTFFSEPKGTLTPLLPRHRGTQAGALRLGPARGRLRPTLKVKAL